MERRWRAEERDQRGGREETKGGDSGKEEGEREKERERKAK